MFHRMLILFALVFGVSSASTAQSKGTVLFVLSAHENGYWLPEVMEPYDILQRNGYDVAFASPDGSAGHPSAASRLKGDLVAQYQQLLDNQQISKPIPLEQVNVSDYVAVYVPGGWGPVFDLAYHPQMQRILAGFYAEQKIVSAVCHGPAAFAGVTRADGKPLVAGLQVTGKSNAEEGARARRTLPFLIEDTFKAQGGQFSFASPNKPYVVHDGLVITGQNPASAVPFGHKLVEVLNGVQG